MRDLEDVATMLEAGMALKQAAARIRELEAQVSTLTAALATARKDAKEGDCICEGCHRPYYADLLVPDEVWAKISPNAEFEDYKGGGLLCPTCIMERITVQGIWTVGFAFPTDMTTALSTAEETGRRKGLEEAAKFVEDHQEGTSNIEGQERYLARRRYGDRQGLAYVTGIRAMIATPTQGKG